MSEKSFDVVFSGAGCAGLSLASELIERTPQKRLALIEPRQLYQRDRTWCYWDSKKEPLHLPVKYRWSKFVVALGKRRVVRESRQFSYACLFADEFYQTKLEQIKKSSNCNLFLGEQVLNVAFEKKVKVHTSKRDLEADFFFDSRPFESIEHELIQDFFGFQIVTDLDYFDPTCFTLMDFNKENVVKDGFHFFYVLPFSKREALVESVVIGKTRLAATAHRNLLQDYLKSQFGLIKFEEVYCEHNCLPMHRVPRPQQDSRHVNIGVRGGVMRTSTGYAFAAIQRASQQLAKAFQINGELKHDASPSGRAEILDVVMLEHLKRSPADGPYLLSSLFFSVDVDTVIRFLCDRSTFGDESKIFAAMPRKLELGKIMAEKILLP